MKLKIPFWATCFTLLGVAILLALGSWQLQRLSWKEQLNATRAHQLQQAINLDSIELDAPLPELDFNRVTLTGHFLQLGRLQMPAKVYKEKVGWHVLELFEQETGRLWLVNRGWVAQDALKTLPPTSEAEQTITAIARAIQPTGRFTPPNNVAGNMWYSYAPRAMLAALATSADMSDSLQARAALNTVLEAGYTSETQPVGGITLLSLPNNHLHYALTWFSLALVLLGVYAAFVRRLNKV